MPQWWPQAVEFAWQTLKGYPQRGDEFSQVRDWLAQRAEDHARAVITADQMLSKAVFATAEGEAAAPVSRLNELGGLLEEISVLLNSVSAYTEQSDHEYPWRQADEIGQRVTAAFEHLRPLLSVGQSNSSE